MSAVENKKIKIEHDSLGAVEVPAHALYGAQTQRAVDNFPVSGKTLPVSFIRTLIKVKSAAVQANNKLGHIDQAICNAVTSACEKLLSMGDESLMANFPVDVFQTGSGTSSNMNANEVIANLATLDSSTVVHPNDHVNFGQSSNDVIPTTIHVSSALEIEFKLLPSLVHLEKIINTKADELNGYCKTGRTHLMDAMPVSFGQTLRAWSSQIRLNINNIEATLPTLKALAQGGTAVGTGINTDPKFPVQFCQNLSQSEGVTFNPSDNFFAQLSSQDSVVSMSGQLKTVAVSITKIANDLRWMNSGPLAGLGEISLKALQPGSSIMPGKVNPVIPESAAMAAAHVIGNDAAITIGGQSGNFELNVSLPMVAYNFLDSINILSNTATLLADKAIATFSVNEENFSEPLAKNPILVTALNPLIGYQKAAEIAKKAYKEKKPILDVAEAETDIPRAELEKILDPVKLTLGGL